jgi:hypothetical protein
MKVTLQRTARTIAVAGISSFVYVSSALAQQSGFAGNLPNINGLPNSTDPGTVITNIISAVLNVLALVAVAVIIIAGIRLILSQGEEEPKEKAKKTIFYAIAGLIIILFAKVIVNLVTQYLASQVQGG